MPSQLYLFDCNRKVDISFPTGCDSPIVIGRGDPLLQCDDNRISRSHGTLQLDGDDNGRTIRITSTHSNPIFFRTGADGVLNILAKDLTATLQEGDAFALLPDQYWYEVRFGEITAPEVSSNEVVSSTGAALRVRTMEEVNSGPIPEVSVGEKRKNGDEPEVEGSKKLRVEVAEASSEAEVTSNQEREAEAPTELPTEVSATNGCEVAAPEAANSEAASTVIKPDPDAAEGSSSGARSPQDQKPDVEVKKETADSTGPPLRPSCQFGIGCYRHTPDHRAQFAHPNDQDYRRPAFPPAPDDAPHCPFGASCYRRNPQHFREYQHPDSTAVAPVSTVPVVPVVRVVPVAPSRRRNHFARDILMAAIINGVGDDGNSDDDDDDDRSLFGSGSESDEYRPDGDLEDEDDQPIHSDSELDSHDEDEE